MPETPRRPLNFERVVTATLASDAQLAPDGARVIYVTEPASQAGEHADSQLWLVDVDGGAPRRLTSAEAHGWAARWSPDGRYVAFLSDRHERGQAQLYVIAPDGGEAVRLTDCPSGVSACAWAPPARRSRSPPVTPRRTSNAAAATSATMRACLTPTNC